MRSLAWSWPRPGYGLTARQAPDGKEPVAFALRPEVKIQGTLLTPAGSPARGVRVVLQSITSGPEEGVGVMPGVTPPSYWPAAAVTDEQGRFTLGSFLEGADAHLTITHPDFAQEEIYVSTRTEVSDSFKAFDIKPLKPEFKHTVATARPVQGVVTAADTGKPMAGVTVEVIPWGPHGGQTFDGKTDAEGRYRISGHAATSEILGYMVTAYPAADSGYIAVSVHHDQGWPAGAKFLEKNLRLPRGQILRGTVTDQDTGKPLAGVSVVYLPKQGNPHYRDGYEMRNRTLTDPEGRFVVTGLAGEGFLVAEGPGSDYRRVTLPRSENGRYMDLFPHGFLKISIPEQGQTSPAALSLRKGVKLEARVVKPDGSPVPQVFASTRQLKAHQVERWQQSERYEQGLFVLPGADPEQTYRVFFVNPELHLGAVADLKFDGKPAEVRLEPTASVRGKLLNEDSSIPKNYQVHALLLLTKEEGKLERFDWFSGDRIVIYANVTQSMVWPKPNADGSFVVDNLIPRTQLYIAGGAGQSVSRTPVVLQPGEVKDLGTLKLAKENNP